MLRANDERLLAAVHRGDRKAWAELTTADFMYVEEGQVSRREVFLEELAEDGLEPLVITNYEVQVLGDTAQVFHEDDVPHRPGVASTKNAHLLMTETWQNVDGRWLLRIVHTDRIRDLPPPVELPVANSMSWREITEARAIHMSFAGMGLVSWEPGRESRPWN
jgi:hypothetical protein